MNFQERYKKYQEAMRAQDANRRRHPSSDTMRDNFSGRPLSVGSSKQAPPLPPPPPPRAMIQSASVCDLTAAHMWNPGMHQVRTQKSACDRRKMKHVVQFIIKK